MHFTRRRLIATGLIALSLPGHIASADDQRRDITAAEAHERAVDGDLILLDIRRPDEWRLTGVGEGAVPLDMRRRDFVEELAMLTGPDRSRPVALICAAGVRSARMARHLEEAGFTNIINVPEGMTGSRAGPGWLRQGLPRVAWQGDQ